MKKRFLTASLLFIILLPAILIPQLARVLDIFFMFAVIVGTIELLNMYDKEKRIPIPIKITVVVLMFGLYLSIINFFCEKTSRDGNLGYGGESYMMGLINLLHLENILHPTVMLMISIIVLLSLLVLDNDFTVGDLGKMFVAIMYIAVCGGAVTVLKYFGTRFIVYLVTITVSTDMFALIFGVKFGKHKMAPQISPKKTWEGAIGGTAVATILGTVIVLTYSQFAHVFHNGAVNEIFDNIFMYKNFKPIGKVAFPIVLTIFLSVCSQIGDLVASKLKRNYGIKDYSNIFPGHGGILDRFDSLFFASAIFLLFLLIEMNLFPWVA